MAYVPRLKTVYKKEIVPALQEMFKYKNINMVPKIEKIVLNVGISKEDSEQKENLATVVADLATITGQRGLITKTKKSVAGFKIRENIPIGCKVTLRGNRMYDFIDRLINVALPRVRDFRGIPANSFDKSGNYSFGIKEQNIFPEINVDNVKKTRGMDITFVITTDNKEVSKELLKSFGMPFNK